MQLRIGKLGIAQGRHYQVVSLLYEPGDDEVRALQLVTHKLYNFKVWREVFHREITSAMHWHV